MAVVVTSALLNTVATMGLATLREKIQLIKRTNREYEKDIVGTTKNSTVNIVIPAAVTAVAVTPGGVHPNDTAAVTPTVVPITVDQWYRAPFAFTDKQFQQVDRGIVPMQIQEAIRGLVNKIESDVWLQYKKFHYYTGLAGAAPFATGIDEFLAAEKFLNDAAAPDGGRFMIMNTAANANWKGLRRNYDRTFADVGVDPAWSQLVPTHTAGTAAGATTNSAGYAPGVKTITLASAGTGTILTGDVFAIAGDSTTYVVVTGDADVSNGGTIVFEPGLVVAIAASPAAITLKASHAVNLYAAQGAIAFAMAPLQAGAQVPGAGAMEATAVDNDSGLAVRLTYFRQFYQDEWSFDALWGSAVPRINQGCRIGG
jgi:hypothetical protein